MWQKAGEKKNWLWRAVWTLLSMVLISTWLLSGLYARFTTSVTGEDSARVAKFKITADTTKFVDSFSKTLTPQSEPLSYQLTVDNASETAVKITAFLESEGNIPLIFTYSKDGGTEKNMTKEDGDVSFSDSLTPADNCIYEIRLKWDDTRAEYAYADGVAALRLRVTAEQID